MGEIFSTPLPEKKDPLEGLSENFIVVYKMRDGMGNASIDAWFLLTLFDEIKTEADQKAAEEYLASVYNRVKGIEALPTDSVAAKKIRAKVEWCKRVEADREAFLAQMGKPEGIPEEEDGLFTKIANKKDLFAFIESESFNGLASDSGTYSKEKVQELVRGVFSHRYGIDALPIAEGLREKVTKLLEIENKAIVLQEDIATATREYEMSDGSLYKDTVSAEEIEKREGSTEEEWNDFKYRLQMAKTRQDLEAVILYAPALEHGLQGSKQLFRRNDLLDMIEGIFDTANGKGEYLIQSVTNTAGLRDAVERVYENVKHKKPSFFKRFTHAFFTPSPLPRSTVSKEVYDKLSRPMFVNTLKPRGSDAGETKYALGIKRPPRIKNK